MRELSSVSLLELNRKNDLGVRGEAEGILIDTCPFESVHQVKKMEVIERNFRKFIEEVTKRYMSHINKN